MKKMKLSVNVSIGEILDKISILEIKKEKITDPIKNNEITKELELLNEEIQKQDPDFFKDIAELKEVNEKLWDIEDKLRRKEKEKEFDEEFIDLARSVYVTNDLRFKVKDRINQDHGSHLKEQKSYEEY